MQFGIAEVDELWRANYAEIRRHLSTSENDGITGILDDLKVDAQARKLADVRTRKLVGRDAWSRFAESRVDHRRARGKSPSNMHARLKLPSSPRARRRPADDVLERLANY